MESAPLEINSFAAKRIRPVVRNFAQADVKSARFGRSGAGPDPARRVVASFPPARSPPAASPVEDSPRTAALRSTSALRLEPGHLGAPTPPMPRREAQRLWLNRAWIDVHFGTSGWPGSLHRTRSGQEPGCLPHPHPLAATPPWSAKRRVGPRNGSDQGTGRTKERVGPRNGSDQGTGRTKGRLRRDATPDVLGAHRSFGRGSGLRSPGHDRRAERMSCSRSPDQGHDVIMTKLWNAKSRSR
jgi:hypothetical protein